MQTKNPDFFHLSRPILFCVFHTSFSYNVFFRNDLVQYIFYVDGNRFRMHTNWEIGVLRSLPTTIGRKIGKLVLIAKHMNTF